LQSLSKALFDGAAVVVSDSDDAWSQDRAGDGPFFLQPDACVFIYQSMEFRQLGNSGLRVPVLSFGTATFGGRGEFFKAWGSTEVDEARRLIDISLEAGANLFDSADGYSAGRSEEVLGEAIKGRRHDVLIATKAFFPMGPGANDVGTSRHHLIEACDASLGLHRSVSDSRLRRIHTNSRNTACTR
jgi:hypothetical protein